MPPSPPIDLRSDTVSRPTAAMRQAIAAAEVGDACFDDDPDTRRLEAWCADHFGMPAALFMVSGTQSNQVALKALTHPGDEVVLHAACHINFFESAATSAFSGVNFNLVHSEDGTFGAEDCERLYRTKARWNANYAAPRVVVLENTVGSRGGTVFPLERFAAVAGWAHERGAQVYLDGARLLHACLAAGLPPTAYTRHVDAMAVCLSKGLGAPIGSVLMGSAAFITQARRCRKWFGGDMHQSGILAAAGLHALQHHQPRLRADHAHMAALHERLRAALPGLACTYRGTNMLYLDVAPLGRPADEHVQALARRGVLCLAWDDRTLRFMTCLDVSHDDMRRAADAIVDVLAAAMAGAAATPVAGA